MSEASEQTNELNPYAPPQAPVEVPAAEPVGTPFMPVTQLKLTVMALTTFNLYLMYWSYKNWKLVEDRSDRNLSPALRAFFYPFTSYWLFKEIRAHGANIDGVSLFSAGGQALLLFLLSSLWRLPDPFWLVSFLSFAPIARVQTTVNEINAKVAPGADRNGDFRGWNYLALIAGGLLLVLSVVGAFIDAR